MRRDDRNREWSDRVCVVTYAEVECARHAAPTAPCVTVPTLQLAAAPLVTPFQAVYTECCGLWIGGIPTATARPAIWVASDGCLCQLPTGWLLALLEDAEAATRRSYGYDERLASALRVAGIPANVAAQLTAEFLPLSAGHRVWTRRTLAAREPGLMLAGRHAGAQTDVASGLRGGGGRRSFRGGVMTRNGAVAI